MPTASFRRNDLQTSLTGRSRQPDVVGDQLRQLVPDREGGGEVDGIQRAKRHRAQLGRLPSNLCVELDELQTVEDSPYWLPCHGHAVRPATCQGVRHLDGCQPGRDPPRVLGKVGAERLSLDLDCRELHDR